MNETLGIEAVLVLLVITNLLLLGSARLSSCIRLVALQGIVIGLLPLMVLETAHIGRALGLAAANMALKGGLFPFLLSRILRESGARREDKPFVGFTLSVAAGVAALVFCLWVGARLDLARVVSDASPLMVSSGFAAILVGLFLIVTRRTAVSQVLGYIVIENGTYTLGVALVSGVPMLVELGVLMDAFVAVFIMGIAAYHIYREFDHIEVDQLDRLKG